MLPQVPQKVVISTVFFGEKPIAAQSEEEQYSFHRGSNPPEGERKQGAINEDLRGNSEDPQGKSDEPGRKSTRRSGNREQGDRTKRPLAAGVVTGRYRKGGLRFASTGRIRDDMMLRFGSEPDLRNSERRGGLSQERSPFTFCVGLK